MGFAGQIFAARIAIGLATPSSRALSDTGEMIAKAIAGIHNNLNSQASKSAKKRRSNTVTEINKTKEAMAKNQKDLNQLMSKGLTASMKTTQRQGGQLGKSFKAQGSQAFAGIKEGALKQSGLAAKLFKGTGKPDLSGIQKMIRIAKNFHKMTKSDQADVLKGNKQALALAQSKVQVNKEELATAQNMRAATVGKGGEKAKKGMGPQKKILDERIKRLKKEQIVVKTSLILEKQYHDEIEQTANTVKLTINPLLKQKEKLAKKDAELTKKAALEHKKFTRILEKAARASKKFGRAAVQTGRALVGNFGESLRHTIGILTAFFFKLQQNTDVLIQFEKELLNANSVFNLTRDELFKTGEVVTQFGQKFGIEMQNGATGLYQLASAGVTANEALQILPETLKLSMAVQGDHNTIAKLTAQTLFGFGMEMDQAAEVTDKFAFAIQKSLIEYQDLGSAVKFALPFFTSTGQSIDQLLGSLQVLTNRALEAGIAGRGLRQAVAEFAESAEDSETNFRKMGVEILNANGEMMQLTEIAQNFADVVGEDTVNNTELLSALISDLNVRGATAFIHLVQNAEEFTKAVEDTANAGGQLDEMVRIQNESLMSQIQILKNNAGAIFLMRDATFEGTKFLNGFHKAVVEGVDSLQNLLVVETENGYQLTEFGLQIQDLAVNGIGALATFLKDDLIPIMKDFSSSTMISKDMIAVYLLPLKVMASIIDKLGADTVKLFLAFNIINSIFPITTALTALAGGGFFTMAAGAETAAMQTARLNAQMWLLQRRLLALAAFGGGIGLSILAIGAYNKHIGSDNGLGVSAYDRVATDNIKWGLPGLGYDAANAAAPMVTDIAAGTANLTMGTVDYAARQAGGMGGRGSGETGIPVMNVQNLNIDPYGGNG